MKVMNYKNFDAQEIANRIIAREEAYLNTDYEALSFEEKCNYALDYTSIVHPGLAPDPARRKALLKALRPELLRRANKEDGFALYVLGSVNADCSAPATFEEYRFLERSVKAGYTPAVVELVSRFLRDKSERKNALHTYLIPALNKITAEKSQDMGLRRSIRSLVSEFETNGDSRVVFYAMARDSARKMVSEGSYAGLAMLCHVSCKKGAILEPCVPEAELAFWQTVDFLVHDYFYARGSHHHATTLGAKLVNERGCDLDVEKIAQVHTELFLRFSYNRKVLLQLVGSSEAEETEDLDDLERICRTQIQSGDAEGYWRLIIVALLRGDRQKLESAILEVCLVEEGKHVHSVLKAYNMLCVAKSN